MSGHGAHFLLVGDSADLPALRGIVSRLPVNAYGQVLVEVATGMQIQPWELPERMTLTWLRRDRMAGVLGGLAPRGELAARAVMAWVAEWIPEQHRDHELPYILWIGCRASRQVDHLYRHLRERFDHLHLHHPHYE